MTSTQDTAHPVLPATQALPPLAEAQRIAGVDRVPREIGDGLYGVDLKQSGDHCYLSEVNDNPNIDADNEDGVMKDALYREIMGYFRRRIDERHRTTVSAFNRSRQ